MSSCKTCGQDVPEDGREPVIRVWHDQDTEDPTSYNDGVRIISFHRDHVNNDASDLFDEHGNLAIWVRSKLRHGTAYWLSYYEHGACAWYVAGSEAAGFEDTWDGARMAGIILMDMGTVGKKSTKEQRRNLAEAIIEEYTMWVNGECYGFSIEDPVTGDIIDSCGGYIGTEYMAEALADALVTNGYEVPEGYTDGYDLACKVVY